MISKRTKVALLIVIMASSLTTKPYSFFPINFFRPWDINLRPPEWCENPLQMTWYYEGGLHSSGYNSCDDHVNVMQIWSSTQDALAMLKGFPPTSPESLFFTNVLMSPQDDGVRGHLSFFGDLDLLANTVFCLRYHVPHNITVGFFLPILSMQLKNVNIVDQTQDIVGEDILVKDNLTNNFSQNINLFDPTLDLSGWKKTGFGDAVVMGEWLQCFPQAKEYLKNVGLNVRAGLTIPTGVRTNIDKIFFVPFGFDGSWGIFFGGGIILNWFNYIRAGIDFEFLTLFGSNATKRIKTQMDQTEFLYLTKARVHTEAGFTQRYNLFCQAYQVYRGLSGSIIYQFWKHGDDKLGLYTNAYSQQIANTAESLQEWTIHQIIFKVEYDCQYDINDCSWFKPQFQFFYKLPFNGSRSVGLHTIGAGITLNF